MKAKLVSESLRDFLKPKSEMEILKTAEETGKQDLLPGWNVVTEYKVPYTEDTIRTTYLADYDIGKNKFEFTDDQRKAYPFRYYQQAIYISKLMDSNYFMQLNTTKVKKIPGFVNLSKSKMDDGFELEESLKGGKGDKLTAKDVCPKQLAIGKKVEKEHSSSKKTATEIALDHLAENKMYYTELIEKGMVDEPAAIREYIKYFGKDKLPKKLLKLVEGVGDKYASKEFAIPDENQDEDYSISALKALGYDIVGIVKDYPIFKNPKSLEIFPAGSRGVITNKGDLYLIPDAMNIIHENILKILDKNGIISKFVPQWENVLEGPLPDFVSVQRVWNKNIFGLSNSYTIKKFNMDEILPKFEPFIEAANEKNPQFEFINNKVLNIAREILTPEEKELEMKYVFR